MSNALAITAVTATLRGFLSNAFSDLPGSSVTSVPPVDARQDGGNPNQVNLFLYRTEVDESLRNTDLHWRVKPGESGHPPLALRLQYLLTAYGMADDEILAHQMLGAAMASFHDHPLLGAAEIEAATSATFPDSNLHEQVERVRITHLPLSLDDISKLWTGFQTPYRISTAYEVSVVLIESQRAVRAPLPVLTRGPGDSGIVSQPSLIPPYPGLSELGLPTPSHGAVSGDLITLSGFHLDGDTVMVRFTHPNLEDPIELNVEAGANANRAQVIIPDEPSNWPIGFYRVAVLVTNNSEQRITNELPLPLIPSIVAVDPVGAPAGDLTLRLDCTPRVTDEQEISCLFGDREISVTTVTNPADPAEPSQLDFEVADAPLGVHVLRLRVDGNDSNPIDYGPQPPLPTQPPQFNTTQQVTMT